MCKNSFVNFCYNEGMLFFAIVINTVLIMTYLFLSSFGTAETSLLIITSGIHAAAENSPQRIISAMDGGDSRQ